MRIKRTLHATVIASCAITLLTGFAVLVGNAQQAETIKWAGRLFPDDPGYVELYVDARRMAINEQVSTVKFEVKFYDARNRLIKTEVISFLDEKLRRIRPEVYRRYVKHSYGNATRAVGTTFWVNGYPRGGSASADVPIPLLAFGKASEWPAETAEARLIDNQPANVLRPSALEGLDLEKSYFISSVSSGKLMDAKDGSEEDWTPIIQTARQEGAPQLWRFEPLHGADEGYYFIHSARSNKCLDVRLGDTADGAAIIQYTCNGGDCQKWALIPIADSAFQLVAKHSGKAIDVNGASLEDVALIQFPRHQGTNQQWRLTPDH